MLDIRQEIMSEVFCKWHLGRGSTGNYMVLHKFSGPDTGPHHSHQFHCRSYILHGGYEEELLYQDGRIEVRSHGPGDVVEIPHDHVHRIIRLHGPECLTLYEVLGPKVQESGFFEWRDGEMWTRKWFEADWQRID